MSDVKHNIPQKIIVSSIIHEQEMDELNMIIEQNKKFDDYIVTYLDFLGFEEKMKGECSNKYLQYLKFLVKGSERLASNISNVNSLETYDIKIFSGNILIAQKVADGKLSNQIISMVLDFLPWHYAAENGGHEKKSGF